MNIHVRWHTLGGGMALLVFGWSLVSVTFAQPPSAVHLPAAFYIDDMPIQHAPDRHLMPMSQAGCRLHEVCLASSAIPEPAPALAEPRGDGLQPLQWMRALPCMNAGECPHPTRWRF